MAGLGLAAIAATLTSGNVRAGTLRTIRLVALGDSLTAGFGLPPGAAFPAVLEKAINRADRPVSIANAGVSGDTTSGGLERLDWAVPDGTDGVIVELGANDMLRGLDPSLTENNLDQIVGRIREKKMAVLLAGMLAAPNLGPQYGERFAGLYKRIAEKHGALLYPFFLDGVAGRAEFTLRDGLHPTVDGVKIIVERIKPVVETFVGDIAKSI
ncbi:arylesterase [Terrirubrum flagellatum]|uniref:arylesterase n=1 Tax=Terrirubrum flagellatum TaxID=2895980 RepID=UPI003CC827C2